ncbi:serine/threonine protein kinase [Streptomyces sp. RK23]|uniref:serine/threonine-protein kinase n=1 Tax=unclassified Streptomyces TaxID=2593676 RepID=UPI001B37BAA4|nr:MULTISPECIES: serine/threonine-protein kinase [unclassified Streptomyces]MBQ0962602.1 serine/threonine protein kinase [Streptomyces sp. RK74B]MBQ1002582.1 serine/threonine protein kinase [Streptomyces sp. RK23]
MRGLGDGDPQRIGVYRLLGRLGAGGMGHVYLARSDRGRMAAVKLVREELAALEEFRERFRQEVESARRVGGYWTAPVLDADTEAAVPWVATGYVAGPSLQQVVGHDHGALPERSVRTLGAGLAHALQDIHAAGIVHRDLKPSNVLVTIDGPRVIDFGIARALQTVTDGGLTRTGALVGSPGFMAPEQVRGDRVTPACDVFCLGSVLTYAATGKLPFGPANSGAHALMFRIAQEDPDLTGVPEGIADLVRDCLRKDPAARPGLAEVLERTGAQDTVTDGRSRDPWLPSALVAQLGRHAVQLLDTETPDSPTHPATPPPPDTRGAAATNAGGGGPGLGAGPGGAVAGGGAPGGAGLGGAWPGGGGPGGVGPGGVGSGGVGPGGVGSGGAESGGAGSGGAVPGAVWPPGDAGPGAAGPGDWGPGGAGAAPGGGPAPDPALGDSASGDSASGGPAFDGPPAGGPPPPREPGWGDGDPVNHLPTRVAGQDPPTPPAAAPGYAPGPGWPAAQAGNQPPYGGGLGTTPPQGPPPPYGVPYGPPHEPARTGRSTALLIVVALVVALGAGGAVYALMSGDGDDRAGGDPTPTRSTGAPQDPGSGSPGPSDPTVGPSTGSTAPAADDGTVPTGYVGDWATAIDNASGTHPRKLTIRQGEVGDTVLTLVADGPTDTGTYHCVFDAALTGEPGADGPLRLGPSRVSAGPASSCSPGGSSTVTLLPDGNLERTNDDTGESLVYTRQ